MSNYPDLKKYVQEMEEMQRLPAASIEFSPLAALAIISHIQLASHHPSFAMSPFAKIAIDAARQLQELFNKDSATYEVIELGWDANEDIPQNIESNRDEEWGCYIEDYAGEAIMDRYIDPEEYNNVDPEYFPEHL